MKYEYFVSPLRIKLLNRYLFFVKEEMRYMESKLKIKIFAGFRTQSNKSIHVIFTILIPLKTFKTNC